MSEPNEPSYYEIALTRRQVTVAFIVLLVCMIVSFLAGVWTVRAGLPAQSAAAAATSPAAVDPAGTAAKLPEYQFFSEGTTAGGGAGAKPAERPPAPAAVGAADQTLLDAVAGSGEPPAAAAGPEATEEAASAPAEAPALAASSPLPAIPPASPARPATADPESSASVYRELEPGQMAVQVFSSADEKQARAILRQLRSAGYQVFLTPGSSGASRVFRVRIGPYTDRAAAQRVADEVKLRFKFDPWIAK